MGLVMGLVIEDVASRMRVVFCAVYTLLFDPVSLCCS